MTTKTSIEAVRLDLAEGPLCGLRAHGGDRGLIVALHGGGYDAQYWHASESLSLLNLGAALGFDVVGFDRPGYCESYAPVGGWSLSQQAEIIYAAITQLQSPHPKPLFVIGHSMGALLTLKMASATKSAQIAGIAVCGAPVRYPDYLHDLMQNTLKPMFASGMTESPPLSVEQRQMMFFGESGTFDRSMVSRRTHTTPAKETMDSINAPDWLKEVLPRVTPPILWTIADAENSSIGGQEMLVEVQAQLTGSQRVIMEMQIGSGHNISLHHVGRAYHLRTLSFFEECLALAVKASFSDQQQR